MVGGERRGGGGLQGKIDGMDRLVLYRERSLSMDEMGWVISLSRGWDRS